MYISLESVRSSQVVAFSVEIYNCRETGDDHFSKVIPRRDDLVFRD